jgi:hypothetical protein
MKYAVIALALAGATLWAQMTRPPKDLPQMPGSVAAGKATSLRPIEIKVDEQIAAANRQQPIDILGATRCIYLHGIGAILSTKVELMRTPTVNPFQRQMVAPQEAVEIYRTKTANLVPLRRAMKNSMIAAAKEMDFVPQTEQIVFVVGLIYQPWENTKGLPTQIVMRADRRSAIAGDIKTEEQ